MFRFKNRLKFKTLENWVDFDPCPWCGGKPIVTFSAHGTGDMDYKIMVSCRKCSVSRFTYFTYSNGDGIKRFYEELFKATIETAKKWNDREKKESVNDHTQNTIGKGESGYWIVYHYNEKAKQHKTGYAQCSMCGMYTGAYDVDNYDNFCSHCGDKKTAMIGKDYENL